MEGRKKNTLSGMRAFEARARNIHRLSINVKTYLTQKHYEEETLIWTEHINGIIPHIICLVFLDASGSLIYCIKALDKRGDIFILWSMGSKERVKGS